MSPRPLSTVSSLEALEPRIAPSTLTYINPFSATYTDAEGDHVTVKFTKAILTPANLSQVLVTTTSGSDDQLTKIDLTALATPARAQDTGIFVTVKSLGETGDGLTSVGIINAAGIDLGTVVVAGDLGEIQAGDGNTKTPAVKALYVKSFGRFGTTTGATSTQSSLIGGLGSLSVAGDMVGATLQTSDATYGKIGSIMIGGSLMADNTGAGGAITPAAGIGSVRIGGSIIGGSVSGSGEINDDNFSRTGSIYVAGSIVGGSAGDSGNIFTGDIGKVVIMGSLVGGGGQNSGSVSTEGSVGSILIGGTLVGGGVDFSGTVNVGGDIGRITIGGSLSGGAGTDSGAVNASGKIGPVVVGGSLIGSGGEGSGAVLSSSSIANVLILGSMEGTSSESAANIQAVSIGPVKILGSLVQTSSDTSGQILAEAGDIRSVVILGSVSNTSAFSGAAAITASGKVGPIYISGSMTGSEIHALTSIASLTVGGTVDHAFIFAERAGAQIGRVAVGGSWIASSLVAGASNTGGSQSFGDGNDAKVAGGSVISKIASVTIGGSLDGTAAAGDHYGFVAEQVGAFVLGGSLLPLTPGAHDDNRTFAAAPDVTIHEV